MRTISINAYEFDELTAEAKQNAINKYRPYVNADYVYVEAKNTVEAFKSVFGLLNVSDNEFSWSIGSLCCEIADLTGLRLHKYIINNYYNQLFKPKYLKTIDRVVNHKMAKNKINRLGDSYAQIYSNLDVSNECVLTGVCYDDAMLEPIYEFLENPTKSVTLAELINNCFDAIRATCEEEHEFIHSDEGVIDSILCHGVEFDAEGNILNL